MQELFRLSLFLACLIVLSLAVPPPNREYRRYDGSNNNIDKPAMGQFGTNMERIDVPAHAYPDNGATMARANLPSGRAISNSLFAWESKSTKLTINEVHTAIGQVIASDMLNTRKGSSERIDVEVPLCDPWKDPNCQGNVTIPFYRSAYSLVNGSRLPFVDASPWIDLSDLYGYDEATVRSLRAGTGGLLATPRVMVTPNPPNIFTPPQGPIPVRGSIDPAKAPTGYIIIELFALEHNRLARKYALENPEWDDDVLFEEARRWNIAQWQKIIARHYIPILCSRPLPPYTGYKPQVNAGLDVFFPTVAMRYGHTALVSTITRLGLNYTESPHGPILLRDSYWRPILVDKVGWEQYFRGMFVSKPNEVDLAMVPDIRNFVFTANGTDVPAINIQRGRDLGVPDYNTVRKIFGLPALTTFPSTTVYDWDGGALTLNLSSIYPDLDSIDPFVGALFEDPLPGAQLGPTMNASIYLQFTRTRDGDRFWYENVQNTSWGWTAAERDAIYNVTLGDIIANNVPSLPREEIPVDVFYTSEVQFAKYAASMAENAAPWPYSGSLEHSETLSDTYKVSWEWNRDDETISWMIQGRSNGWIGIGWYADPGTMKNADIVLCSGTHGVQDYYALDVGKPELDTAIGGTNSLTNVRFERNNLITTCWFTKPRQQGNDNRDHTIEQGPVKTIFAFNPTSDELVYHGPTRSAASYVDYLGVYGLSSPDNEKALIGGVVGGVLGGLLLGCCLVVIVAAVFFFVYHKRFGGPAEEKKRLLAEAHSLDDEGEETPFLGDKGVESLEEEEGIEVEPKDLHFGLREVDKAAVNKVLSDKLLLTNWGSGRKLFKFIVPQEEFKYKIELWPGQGSIREGKSVEVSVDITLFMTTTVKRNIRLEISSPGDSDRASDRVYQIPIHLIGEISTRLDPDEVILDAGAIPIGSGSFGIVYKGTYRNQSVAIKLLKKQMDPFLIEEFNKEIGLMENLRSAYIINFIGATHIPGKRSLVTEYCKLGSLKDIIFNSKIVTDSGDTNTSGAGATSVSTKTATSTMNGNTSGGATDHGTYKAKKGVKFNTLTMNELKRIKVALDMAQAIHFLHSNGVMHRDVKPDNFLVVSWSSTAPQMVRLADFGTSRSVAAPRIGSGERSAVHTAFSHTAGLGTPIYMAPEILSRKSYSMKVDVFSFGVLLWALWHREEPYINFNRPWDIPRFVISGKRLDVNQDAVPDERIRDLIESCWAHDPDERMGMKEVMELLDKIYEEKLEEKGLVREKRKEEENQRLEDKVGKNRKEKEKEEVSSEEEESSEEEKEKKKKGKNRLSSTGKRGGKVVVRDTEDEPSPGGSYEL